MIEEFATWKTALGPWLPQHEFSELLFHNAAKECIRAVLACTYNQQSCIVKIVKCSHHAEKGKCIRLKELKHEYRVLQYLQTHGVKGVPRALRMDSNPADEKNETVALTLTPRGESLRAYMLQHTSDDQKSKLSQQFSEHVARALCPIIQSLHQVGVLHRDIKPDNIVVHQHKQADGTTHVYFSLIDFGQAWLFSKNSKPQDTSFAQRLYYMRLRWVVYEHMQLQFIDNLVERIQCALQVQQTELTTATISRQTWRDTLPGIIDDIEHGDAERDALFQAMSSDSVEQAEPDQDVALHKQNTAHAARSHAQLQSYQWPSSLTFLQRCITTALHQMKNVLRFPVMLVGDHNTAVGTPMYVSSCNRLGSLWCDYDDYHALCCTVFAIQNGVEKYEQLEQQPMLSSNNNAVQTVLEHQQSIATTPHTHNETAKHDKNTSQDDTADGTATPCAKE